MLWTIGQFPELDHLGEDQRAAVLAQVPWWTYPLIVARSVLSAAVVGAIAAGVAARRVSVAAAAALFVAVAGGLATCFYLLQLRRVRVAMRHSIAEGFRGRRPPFCLACGYDLRGSAGTVLCPECGGAIDGGRVA